MPTQHPENGNSTKSLDAMRDYVELLYDRAQDAINAQKELLCTKIEALEKATSLAKANSEIRMEINNEWKDRSIEDAKTFARKEALDGMESRIRQLEISKATLDGKASQSSVNITYVFSAIGIILGVIGLLMQLFR